MSGRVTMLADDIWRLVDVITESEETLPYVLLLYAGIDIMASLDGPRAREDVTRQDFVAWVDRYLLPGSALECSGLELYGARCALLHTYGSESALSRAGQVRQVLHARGTRVPIDLAATHLVPWPDDYVVVFLSEARAAFRQAVERFDSALVTDPEKLKMIAERVETHWARCFTDPFMK